jgi:hypothetical protein
VGLLYCVLKSITQGCIPCPVPSYVGIVNGVLEFTKGNCENDDKNNAVKKIHPDKYLKNDLIKCVLTS